MILYDSQGNAFDITQWDTGQAHYQPYYMPGVIVPQPPALQFAFVGPGSTKVDTGSIYILADSMDFLTGYAKNAHDVLMNMPRLAPGGFPEANVLRLKVIGPASQTAVDLLDNYKGILVDIMDGLASLKTALYEIGAKYDQVNNENTISVAQLQTILSDTSTEFSRMFGSA